MQKNILLSKELCLRLEKSLRRLIFKKDILVIKEQRNILNTSICAPAYYGVLGTSPNKRESNIINPAALYNIIGYGGKVSDYIVTLIPITLITE